MAGRLDATWRAYRPDRWQGPDVLTVPPSSYLRRFHVDSNVWSLPALRLLVEVLGPDRILVGNDQPPVWFPLAESLALLDRLDLSAADREAVRWRNASRLFGLEPVRAALARTLFRVAWATVKPQGFRKDPARRSDRGRPGMDGENSRSAEMPDMV